MDSAPRPLNKIQSPGLAVPELDLNSFMEAFLNREGPWTKFHAAKDQIFKIVEKNLEAGLPNKYHTELSHSELERFLIKDWGLLCEIGNGPEFIIKSYFQSASALSRLPVETKIKKLIDSFNSKSQFADTEMAQRWGYTKIADQGQKIAETKDHAMTRCADIIEDWAKTNKETIPAQEYDTLNAALKDYRSSYEVIQQSLKQAGIIIASQQAPQPD